MKFTSDDLILLGAIVFAISVMFLLMRTKVGMACPICPPAPEMNEVFLDTGNGEMIMQCATPERPKPAHQVIHTPSGVWRVSQDKPRKLTGVL